MHQVIKRDQQRRDKQVCPGCHAAATLHDPFPDDAYVAPCHMHILDDSWCMNCGDPKDEDLRCIRCESRFARLLDWADDERKREKGE